MTIYLGIQIIQHRFQNRAEYLILIGEIMIDVADCNPCSGSNFAHGSILISFFGEYFFGYVEDFFLYVFFQILHSGVLFTLQS